MQVLRDAVGGSQHHHDELYENPRLRGRRSDATVGGRRKGTASSALPSFPASLEDRVDDLVVVEFRSDSSTAKQLKFSVRGLYQYVLSAITGGGDVTAEEAGGRPPGDTATFEDGGRRPSPVPKSSSDPRRGRKGKKGKGAAPANATNKKEANRVTYRDRLGSYLSPRDMRRLAIPVSKRNEPEIIVRRHVICVNIDPLPAIILRDRLLVVVPIGGGGGGAVPAGSPEPPTHIDMLIDQIREALSGGDDAGSKWSDEEERDDSSRTKEEMAASDRPGASSLLSRLAPLVSSRHGPKVTGMGDTDDEGASDDGSTGQPGEGEDDEEEEEEEEDEWKEIQRREWLEMPFELQCLDSILTCNLDKLVSETREVQAASREYIHRLVNSKNKNHHHQDPHLIICAVKDAVSDILSRVRVIVKALTRMLDDYEDMSLMNLSRVLSHPELFIQPVPFGVLERESDQPELILEAHLQTGLTLESTLDLVKNQIESASVLIEQNLDAVRNRLLLANMILTVVTVCLGLASLVGSFMGMNLLNGIEESTSAFLIVVISTSVTSVVIFLAILAFLFYSGTIPVPGLGGG